MIKMRTAVHGNIDPELIRPDIKVAQDIYIHPILGTALFNKLITYVDAGLVPAGPYKTLLDDYILDTLMWYVLAEMPITTSYQFWNKGVMRKQSDEADLPSMTELEQIRDVYRNRAEWYAKRLQMYLKQTATATVLPEYLSPGDGVDTIDPVKSTFTMPVYLGDTECCKKSIEERYQGNRPNC